MQLLGEKVPQNTWKKMISNALECDLVGNEANFNKSLEVGEEMNLSESDGELHQHFPSFNPTSRVPLTHVIKGFFVDSIKLKVPSLQLQISINPEKTRYLFDLHLLN